MVDQHVEESSPKLKLENVTFSDVNGNNNKKINIAELIKMNITLKNDGGGKAQDVKIKIKHPNNVIFIPADTANFGDIAASKSPQKTFMFYVAEKYKGGKKLLFSVAVFEKGKKDTIKKSIERELIFEKARGNFFSDVTEAIRKKILTMNDVFVVIGIDNYLDNFYQPLDYAVNDAKYFRDFLKEHTSFKLFKQLYNDTATQSSIRNVIDDLSHLGDNTRIIIYYAGHGGYNRINYFAPYDANHDRINSTTISMRDIKDWDKTLKARHVLFIFDACRSGEILELTERGKNYHLDRLFMNKGRNVITAGTGKEAAIEHSELKHGLLTYFLIRGIKGEADVMPKDNCVTLNELRAYLQEKVEQISKGKQKPKVGSLNMGEGELFFEIIK